MLLGDSQALDDFVQGLEFVKNLRKIVEEQENRAIQIAGSFDFDFDFKFEFELILKGEFNSK